MTDPRIGQFVVRLTDAGQQGKAHVAESVIADEPVTRCGRRLPARPGTRFGYGLYPDPCRQCIPSSQT